MKYLIFSFVLLGLVACSKEKSNNKALDGEWKTVSFSLFDYQSLENKIPSDGTIRFIADKKKNTGQYESNLLFDFNGAPLNFIEKGTYHIEEKNQIKLLSTDNEITSVTLVYETKEDLVLEFPNKNYLRYYIVLKKQ